MPRDVVALVSADDFVSAVRVYADRANDLLRRRGLAPIEAIEVCETQAIALLQAVVTAPETVVDLSGWWFARAIELTRDDDPAAVRPAEEALSVLAGTSGEAQVRRALAALPEPERTALALRDSYDLPPQAVGVALGIDPGVAADLTATGRLVLVATYDDRLAPDLSGHTGNTRVDVVTLSKLAEGTLEAPRAAPLRRHVGNCAACEDVLETLAKARRLAAALPIIAMDDEAREAMIERIDAQATTALPNHEAVLRAIDEDHDPGPAISPVVAVIVLVLALALGIAIALISHAGHSPSPLPVPAPATSSAGPSAPSVSSPAATPAS